MNIDTRLTELGLKLPEAPKPVASYVPAVRSGNLLYVSGQLPLRDGKLMATGRVPSDVSLDKAQQCAAQCVLNGLAIVRDALGGDLSQLVRAVRLGVFVASISGYGDQPKVANGASDLLVSLMGDAGRHARAAVGVNTLPLGAPVEVEFLFEVRA
jgi:enamine deaminase RidA (YjgF/YER057c/UK114 family)